MALCFRDRSTRFYVTISGDFERFQYFNFEKSKTIFKKSEYCFLVEISTIESATF